MRGAQKSMTQSRSRLRRARKVGERVTSQVYPLPVLKTHAEPRIKAESVAPGACADHETGMELPIPQPRPLIDGQGRTIDHLRLSVTSACNLRCLYCRPSPQGVSCEKDLTDDQRMEIVEYLYARRGLRQLRITGGEPLLHASVVSLIARIRKSAPALSLAMTTNGLRLASMARALRRAGLDRLNVSLDTIDPIRYRSLTGGCVDDVIRGIDAAFAAGFPPPKLNAVVLTGTNENRIVELAQWAFRRSLEIRFLEAMPIGPAAQFNRRHFVPASRIRRGLESRFVLRPIPRNPGETAARYRAESSDQSGILGIIAPISESFCGQCRRMRLTADGRLFPCLLDTRSVHLSDCWRDGRLNVERVDDRIGAAIGGKKSKGLFQQDLPMIALGG